MNDEHLAEPEPDMDGSQSDRLRQTGTLTGPWHGIFPAWG